MRVFFLGGVILPSSVGSTVDVRNPAPVDRYMYSLSLYLSGFIDTRWGRTHQLYFGRET